MMRKLNPSAAPMGMLLALACVMGPACAPESAETPQASTPRRPNILFISVDTLRADHLGCYGYERATSPNIDALAQRGHLFETAITPMNATLPSHSAMFTSLHPVQLGVPRNGRVLSTEVQTLAEILTDAGYDTGGFVSATPLNPKFGIDQGFATYAATERGTHRIAGKTRRIAKHWLERKRDKPFFAFVHFFDPHSMYEAPENFRERFGAPPFRHPALRQFPADLTGYSEQLRDSIVNSYDAEIAYADAQVGKLLRDLEATGQADNTIIVFVSDHGETLDELVESCGFLFAHSEFLSHHELRVPLILVGPPGTSAAAGRTADAVSTMDLAPTLLEWVGLPIPPSMTGRSLVPHLSGAKLPGAKLAQRELVSVLPENPDEPANAAAEGTEISILSGERLWVRSEGRGDLLYDIAQSPPVLIASEDQDPAVLAELESALEEWSERCTPLFQADSTGVDPELLQQLRDLGYAVGDDLR